MWTVPCAHTELECLLHSCCDDERVLLGKCFSIQNWVSMLAVAAGHWHELRAFLTWITPPNQACDVWYHHERGTNRIFDCHQHSWIVGHQYSKLLHLWSTRSSMIAVLLNGRPYISRWPVRPRSAPECERHDGLPCI